MKTGGKTGVPLTAPAPFLSDEIQFIECSLSQVKYKTKQTCPSPPNQFMSLDMRYLNKVFLYKKLIVPYVTEQDPGLRQRLWFAAGRLCSPPEPSPVQGWDGGLGCASPAPKQR